jgi:hypothetical protein
MTVFNKSESLAEFKHRLYSLTDKLNNVHKDLDQPTNKTEVDA